MNKYVVFQWESPSLTGLPWAIEEASGEVVVRARTRVLARSIARHLNQLDRDLARVVGRPPYD